MVVTLKSCDRRVVCLLTNVRVFLLLLVIMCKHLFVTDQIFISESKPCETSDVFCRGIRVTVTLSWPGEKKSIYWLVNKWVIQPGGECRHWYLSINVNIVCKKQNKKNSQILQSASYSMCPINCMNDPPGSSTTNTNYLVWLYIHIQHITL